jgi:hypothetical protein
MPKIQIQNLAVEITRKCNKRCRHCLRGGAQKRSTTTEIIDKVLAAADFIKCVVPTGGEPFLEPDLTAHLISEAGRKDELTTFFIATNGSVSPFSWDGRRILNALGTCEDTSVIRVSQGIHHKPCHEEWHDLDGVMFDNREVIVSPYTDDNILMRGLAEANGLGRRVEPAKAKFRTEGKNTLCVSMLYVDVFGRVFSDCDLSYRMMDSAEKERDGVYLCNVTDLGKTLEDAAVSLMKRPA